MIQRISAAALPNRDCFWDSKGIMQDIRFCWNGVLGMIGMVISLVGCWVGYYGLYL